jgi:hypothetical protein
LPFFFPFIQEVAIDFEDIHDKFAFRIKEDIIKKWIYYTRSVSGSSEVYLRLGSENTINKIIILWVLTNLATRIDSW